MVEIVLALVAGETRTSPEGGHPEGAYLGEGHHGGVAVYRAGGHHDGAKVFHEGGHLDGIMVFHEGGHHGEVKIFHEGGHLGGEEVLHAGDHQGDDAVLWVLGRESAAGGGEGDVDALEMVADHEGHLFSLGALDHAGNVDQANDLVFVSALHVYFLENS